MDEHEPDVTRYGRRAPSRRRVLARRLGAVLVAAGVLGGGAWAGASLVRDEEPPPPVETAPPLARLRIIFPEGFTLKEMAERVAAVREIAITKRRVTPRLTRAGYVDAAAEATPPRVFRKDWAGRSLEGFLFPATYEFSQYTTSQRLVRDQLRAFGKQWGKIDLRYARSRKLMPYDVLIIASMIEKEAAVARERPLIAAVIYNRLRLDIALGIDATIRYGLGIPGTESLRESDVESDNPYNTRKVAGLPPTPISNPGLASMQAAAMPAKVDYLFFLRKPDSLEHFFTASQAEFDRRSCEWGYSC